MRTLAFVTLGLAAGCAGSGWNGRVERWGTLREVLREGDVRGKASLQDAVGRAGAVGVGALADLAGEVTVCDGETWIARSDPEGRIVTVRRAREGDQAAFLALATVDAWRETTIDAPLDWEGLEALVAGEAERGGLAGVEAFPFLVEGEFERLEAHVLNGRCPFATDPSRRGEPARFARERGRGRLVGLFTTLPAGTLTHHGSRLHVHVVLDGHAEPSGHVDRSRVAPGSVLRLPAR